MAEAGASRGRRKASEVKWEQILDSAATVFAEKGYEATTIRDVAEAVGMLGGSLYYYIDTKEDLLYALLDTFHREGTAAIEQVEQELVADGLADDPLVVLRAVCERHADHNARSGTLSTVFHNDFRYLSDERKKHIVEARRRHDRRIEDLIKAAQSRGEIGADQDPKLTSLAILSLLNSTNSWYHAERNRSGPPIGRFLADLVIDGLATRTVPAPAAKSAAPPRAARKAATKRAAVKSTTARTASPTKTAAPRKQATAARAARKPD